MLRWLPLIPFPKHWCNCYTPAQVDNYLCKKVNSLEQRVEELEKAQPTAQVDNSDNN